MRRFLLASHANFAEGIYGSLRLIMGDQPNVEFLCAYMTEDFDLNKEISFILENLKPEDELIVVTDLLGGSVNNEFMNYVNRMDKKVFVVSGLNLGLLITLLSRQFEEKDTGQIIVESIDESKESICLCNKILEDPQNIDDEF